MASNHHEPRCIDSRDCFAKFTCNGIVRCKCLRKDPDIKGNQAWKNDGDCVFAKPDAYITDDKYYPHRDKAKCDEKIERYKNRIARQAG